MSVSNDSNLFLISTSVFSSLFNNLFLKVAKAAHERDITINSMINNIIKDKLHDLDYKFEHNPKPQFLAENK